MLYKNILFIFNGLNTNSCRLVSNSSVSQSSYFVSWHVPFFPIQYFQRVDTNISLPCCHQPWKPFLLLLYSLLHLYSRRETYPKEVVCPKELVPHIYQEKCIRGTAIKAGWLLTPYLPLVLRGQQLFTHGLTTSGQCGNGWCSFDVVIIHSVVRPRLKGNYHFLSIYSLIYLLLTYCLYFFYLLMYLLLNYENVLIY